MVHLTAGDGHQGTRLAHAEEDQGLHPKDHAYSSDDQINPQGMVQYIFTRKKNIMHVIASGAGILDLDETTSGLQVHGQPDYG